MSLVGSLEDLSLGDILQIISLSQKSGVLALETSGCDGRIVFVNGLVRGAAIKGGPQDLRGVLVAGGFVSDDEFSAAEEHAESRGCPVVEAVAEIGALPAERVESLCREAIESAVITMFSWSKGDFSFDVRSEPLPGDPELLAPGGLNAQYLAMEGARLRDEGGDDAGGADGEEPGAGEAPTGERFDEMSAHEMFGVAPDDDEEDEAAGAEPAPGPNAAAVDALAMAGVARVEDVTNGLSVRASELAAEIMALGEAVGDEEIADLEAEVEAVGEYVAEFCDTARDASDEAFGVPDAVEEIDLDAPVDLEAESAGADADGEALLEAATFDDALPEDDAEADAPGADIGVDAAEADTAVATAATAEAPASAEGGVPLPLVAVDRDLVALEWVKDALQDEFAPIHIFQQTEQAMARIRQYLVRGVAPVVLVAPDIDVDKLGGIVDPVDFVARLKAQFGPLIEVLGVRGEGEGDGGGQAVDGLFGQIAVTHSLVSEQDLERALRLQEQLASQGNPMRIGEILVRARLM